MEGRNNQARAGAWVEHSLAVIPSDSLGHFTRVADGIKCPQATSVDICVLRYCLKAA